MRSLLTSTGKNLEQYRRTILRACERFVADDRQPAGAPQLRRAQTEDFVPERRIFCFRRTEGSVSAGMPMR
jgi:hypothetical protein